MSTCEDYPCCGHTDGLPCDWTYTPEAQEFDRQHFMCDHESGWCEAEGDPDEDCADENHACVDCEDSDEGWVCSYCERPCPEDKHKE